MSDEITNECFVNKRGLSWKMNVCMYEYMHVYNDQHISLHNVMQILHNYKKISKNLFFQHKEN